jgi:DNA-binding NarL/FixJ family response regulator
MSNNAEGTTGVNPGTDVRAAVPGPANTTLAGSVDKIFPAIGELQPEKVIRILIADDQPTILKMVKQILQAHSGFEVVGEAPDGRQAVTLAAALKPDVIVLNVTMPTMSGFAAARLIRGQLPDSAIVILSSHKDKQFIAEARKVGARGYVQKSDADNELIRAINTVVKGEEFFFLP